MTTLSRASSAGVSSSQSLLIEAPRGVGVFKLASFFAACVVVSGASTPTYAASLNVDRVNGSAPCIVVAARDEDTKTPVQEMLAEIKDCSGLTWDQIGKLVGVSRKTVHNWVSGLVAKPAHVEALSVLLERVRTFADLRPYQIKRRLMEALDVGRKLEVVDQPAILVADQTPVSHQLRVRRGSALRRKSSGESVA